MRTYKCPFCEKEMLPNTVHHIYKCKNRDLNLTKDEIKMQYLIYNFGEDTIAKIINDYQELKSLPDIKRLYEIDFKSTMFILNQYNIKLRTISESAHKISKHKYKTTCLEKYGVENVSQSQDIKDKKANTFIEHYGVDNIWKTVGYNVKCIENGDPEKHQKHLEALYKGRAEFWKNIDEDTKRKFVEKVYSTKAKKGLYHSSLEERVSKILDILCISYKRQFFIKGLRHPYDFCLTNSKIIIEVNGDFWHANPDIYKATDIVKIPGYKNLIAENIWNRDKKNLDFACKNGYKVLTLWENKMRKSSDEELTLYLLNLINNI
jgi:G:T-mismatch repair DNA endonuclease (very short patch repair protein)